MSDQSTAESGRTPATAKKAWLNGFVLGLAGGLALGIVFGMVVA